MVRLNIESLIYKAINTFNGHINYHLLVRLFEIIVKYSQLDKCYIYFENMDKYQEEVNSAPLIGTFESIQFPHREPFTIRYSNDVNVAKPIIKHEQVEENCLKKCSSDENINKLIKQLKEEKFKKIFGKTEKSNDTPLSLSVRDFQEFDLDYRNNFQDILSILELQNEMIKKVLFDIEELKNSKTTKVDHSEHMEFKRVVSLALSEIMECISKTTQTKSTQSDADEQCAKSTPVSVKHAPADLTINNNVSVATVDINAKKENTGLNETRESLNKIKTIKKKSNPKKTKEPKADVPVPMVKENTDNETIDFDRLRNYQKSLPFLVMPEKLLEVLQHAEMIQDNPKQTNTNVQSVKPTTKSIKHTRNCIINVSETAKKPKTTKKTIALNKFQNRSEMTQTKQQQTNSDDQTSKPATIPIKYASPPLLATNSVSLPFEKPKPKPMKENLEHLFEGLKKLHDSKIKRDHLVKNYTDIPIGKPATMLINHAPIHLITNKVSLPLEKPKPKKENIIYLLDELRKQINCETAQYKPTHTNTNMPNAKLNTMLVKHVQTPLTTNNDSLPVEKLKSKKENRDDVLKQIVELQNNIQNKQIQSNTNMPSAKSATMSIKHASAPLTKNNTTVRIKRPKTKKKETSHLTCSE